MRIINYISGLNHFREIVLIMMDYLLQELRLKTCLLTQDAVMCLSKDKSNSKSGQQQELLKAVSDNLQELTDIVSEVACFPYVWCDFQLVGGERLVERVKFCILEIQENLENFADKKETTIGVSLSYTRNYVT